MDFLVLTLKTLLHRFVAPYCMECGAKLLARFFAPEELYKKVGAPARCCTECFTFLATRRGLKITWLASEARAPSVELVTRLICRRCGEPLRAFRDGGVTTWQHLHLPETHLAEPAER